MMFSFFMTLTTVASAQFHAVVDAPLSTKQESALQKYNETHGTSLSTANEFAQSTISTQANLDKWTAVVRSYSRAEMRAEMQANPAVITRNGVKSDSDYYYLLKLVKHIQSDLN